MKRLLFILLIAPVFSFGQYNLESYNKEKVYSKKHRPQKWGGYATIQGGISPTHPRMFIGASVGVVQKYGQLSVSAMPSLTNTSFLIFNSMIGYRQAINWAFVVVPKIGYWSYWEGDKPVNWNKGNHICYGVELNKRVENNLELTVEWVDYRGMEYNGMKIGTIGVRYIF